MQINQINSNQNFKAYLGGEFSKVVKISKRAGLTDEAAKKLVDEIQALCPKREDMINLYFRKQTPIACPYRQNEVQLFRSGVSVTQDGVEKKLNIDPRQCSAKDLLEKMLLGVKKLVKNQVQSTQKHIWYQVDDPSSWLAKYEDPSYYL